jgi:hypothetical protein
MYLLIIMVLKDTFGMSGNDCRVRLSNTSYRLEYFRNQSYLFILADTGAGFVKLKLKFNSKIEMLAAI